MQIQSFEMMPARQTWILSGILGLCLSFMLVLGFIYPAWQQGLALQQRLLQVNNAAKNHVDPTSSSQHLNFSEALELFNQANLAHIKVLTAVQDHGHYHLVLRGSSVDLKMFTQIFALSSVMSVQLQKQAGVDVYELDVMFNDLQANETLLQAQASIPPVATPAHVVGQFVKNGRHYCVLEDAPHAIHFVERQVC